MFVLFVLLRLSFLHQLHLLTLEFVLKKVGTKLADIRSHAERRWHLYLFIPHTQTEDRGFNWRNGRYMYPSQPFERRFGWFCTTNLIKFASLYYCFAIHCKEYITLRFFSSKYQWYKDQMWHEWHCSSFLIETKYPPQWANPNIFILTFFCVLKVHCYCKNRSKR